jgi:hypothetical protein
MPDKG